MLSYLNCTIYLICSICKAPIWASHWGPGGPVVLVLYSKFVAGASDCHLLGYSLLAKIFVNFRDSLLAYFVLVKNQCDIKRKLLGNSLLG